MKKGIVIVITIAIACIVQIKTLQFLVEDPIGSENFNSPIENILPGMGFASDTQALGKTVCYKTETITRTGQQSIVHFDEALDYSNFLSTFNLDTSIKGGYGIFSANALFKYSKSLEDTSYSLSINYYQKINQKVMMTFSYNPSTILTDTGKGLYNDGKNPMFRLLCGDTLVSSYEEGAALIYSMKIVFTSREEKKQFESEIGLSFGGFISVSNKISTAATKYKLQGKIELNAFQMGGDPTQLSKLLTSKVVECEIKNIQACQDTVKQLINYSSVDFPSQFKKDPSGIWTSPLVPLVEFKTDYLVSDFGIKLSPSYVTPEVKLARNDLMYRYSAYDYYQSSIDDLIAHYPFKLTTFSELSKNLKKTMYTLAKGTPTGVKALDCFEFPFKCTKLYQEILASLDVDIEKKILDHIANMKGFSHFSQVFKKDSCLSGTMKWASPFIMEIFVYPLSKDEYTITVSTPPLFHFDISGLKATSIRKFEFKGSGKLDTNVTFDFSVESEESNTELKGVFKCKEETYKIDKEYPIEGTCVGNAYYFEKFSPEMES